MLKALPLHPSLLHPLTGQPLRAIGARPDGSPLWPIMGASEDSDDANDKGDEDEAEDGETEDSGDADKGDEETDWKSKFEAQQRISRNLERRTRKDATRLKQLESGKPTPKGDKKDAGAEVDADKIREEAKAEAAAEVLAGRVEDKIEAKASAFADPEDAVAVLLRSHDIEDFIDDGKPDVDAIADALKELGEKKPHLLAQGGKRFQGGADGGARKEKPTRAKTLGDAIARQYDKS